MNLTSKLSLFFLFIATITFSQDWIKTDITDFASIDFPSIADLNKVEGKIIFSASDESAIYIISISKLTDEQDARLTKEEILNLYQGVARGSAEAINAEIVSMKEIRISKIPALELEYFASSNSDLPSQRFKRILYIDKHIISFDFWPIANLKDIANQKKSKFFNSFLIHSDLIKEHSKTFDNNDANTQSNTGFFVGKIVFFLFLIALIIGSIFLIKYLLKKNKKNNTVHSLEKKELDIMKIICKKCESENTSNSKYCNRCGFELPKNT